MCQGINHFRGFGHYLVSAKLAIIISGTKNDIAVKTLGLNKYVKYVT